MTGEKNPDWIRLPKPKERCPHTGLSRSSLVEIIDQKNPETGQYLILQYRKERFGKQRRVRLIHRESLMEYLESRALAQNLKWKPGVNNPGKYSVEQVLNDSELFGLFLGEEGAELNSESWEEGFLSSRDKRIRVLRDLGWIE